MHEWVEVSRPLGLVCAARCGCWTRGCSSSRHAMKKERCRLAPVLTRDTWVRFSDRCRPKVTNVWHWLFGLFQNPRKVSPPPTECGEFLWDNSCKFWPSKRSIISIENTIFDHVPRSGHGSSRRHFFSRSCCSSSCHPPNYSSYIAFITINPGVMRSSNIFPHGSATGRKVCFIDIHLATEAIQLSTACFHTPPNPSSSQPITSQQCDTTRTNKQTIPSKHLSACRLTYPATEQTTSKQR
jgi:hypothetical protein